MPQEVYRDRVYQYLIGGEAFDWLLLVERLCPELDAVMTEEEKDRLLFKGQLPGQVTLEVFRDLLGTIKYRGYLNTGTASWWKRRCSRAGFRSWQAITISGVSPEWTTGGWIFC